MTTSPDVASRFGENVILVFVGHSSDAAAEAQAVLELEHDIQRLLDDLTAPLQGKSPHNKVKFWEWTEDAEPWVGGQDTVITPVLQRADVALFLFKERIGEVTWKELELRRSDPSTKIPIITLFPSGCPHPEKLSKHENALQWANLLEKKGQLTSDWTFVQSRSALPLQEYADIDHLKEIIKEQFRKFLYHFLITPTIPTMPPKADPASSASTNKPFMDELTALSTFDSHAVARYRERLRDEVRLALPSSLSDGDFLAIGGYLCNSRLTRAGVLLFTSNPEIECVSAQTRCVGYHGDAKTSPRNRVNLIGPIYSQITGAFDFVMMHIEKFDIPPIGSMTAATVYRFPPKCLREVIANALCHRDYSDNSRMTYIRIFSNRIEIANPGEWGAGALAKDVEVRLSDLAHGQSVAPNFRLAHSIACISDAEMEGSGIDAST